MKNPKILIIVLFIIMVVIVLGYYFWPTPVPSPQSARRNRKPSVTPTESQSIITTQLSQSILTSTRPVLSESTVPIIFMEGASLEDESPFGEEQFSRDTGYKGIGERDLFPLLIPPPPPPPPPRKRLDVVTRNWVLWEIISDQECVIQDTRTMSHNLKPGDTLEIAIIERIVPSEDRVLLRNSEDTTDIRWMQLQPLETTTKGWKLKGTVGSLKQAFIVTGDNQTHKVKEGDILQHVTIKQVLNSKVILKSGTMTKELTP